MRAHPRGWVWGPGAAPRVRGRTSPGRSARIISGRGTSAGAGSDFLSEEIINLPTTVDANAMGFQMSAFDGTYVYFFPYRKNGTAHGTVARYDTRLSFTDGSSWSTGNLATVVGATAVGFLGGIYLNGSCYFVPYETVGKLANDLFVKFDVTKQLNDATAYQTFSGGGVFKGWATAAHDGRYVYYCPVNSIATGVLHGRFVRYDSTADFTVAGSWEEFTLTDLDTDAKGMQTVGFDGRYIYVVPYAKTILVRYDTTQSFTSASSYQTIDMTEFGGATARGYTGIEAVGGPTNGYVYFCPWKDVSVAPVTYQSRVARFNTAHALDDPHGWEFYTLTNIKTSAKGYEGTWTDGKYAYLLPTFNGFQRPPIARHQISKSLDDSTSWSFFNATIVYPACTGATYVKPYVYPAPYGVNGNRGNVHRLEFRR